MKLKNKGVSALIATILLIVVAVALIAIILTWGKSFTTDSLADTTDVIDKSCTGAAIVISDCKIDADNNLEFFVKNISSTYRFLTADNFLVDLTDNGGNYKTNVVMSTYTNWTGLQPGEMVKIDMNKNISEIGITGNVVDISVRSGICVNDAIATFNNCHQ
jgi:flagellin-like protein